MNAAQALRAIRFDEVRYIQQQVTVDFDSLLQVPLYYRHGSEKHFIRETLGRFQMHSDNLPGGFLVKTAGDEVFFLYLQRWGQGRSLNECCWIDSFLSRGSPTAFPVSICSTERIPAKAYTDRAPRRFWRECFAGKPFARDPQYPMQERRN